MLHCFVFLTSSSPMSIDRPIHALHVLSAALALGMAGTATAGVSYRLDRPRPPRRHRHHRGGLLQRRQCPRHLGGAARAGAAVARPGRPDRAQPGAPAGRAGALACPSTTSRAWPGRPRCPPARGLQAVSIEGQPAMMALDATGRDSGTLASTPAQGPVVDARSGQPVPAPEVAAAGASPQGGPSPDASAAPGQADAFALSQRDLRIQACVFRHRHARQDHRALPDQRQVPPLQPGRQPARELVRELLSGIQTSLWDLQSDSMPFIDTTFNPAPSGCPTISGPRKARTGAWA